MPTTNIDLSKRLLSLVLRGSGIFLAFLVVFNGSCPPPAVVDEPASNLTIKISVLDIESPPSDGKVAMVVQFFSGGKYVQLAANATVTCNGINLPLGGLGYAERVPLVGPGGTYHFVHSRGGVNSQVNVTVPSRPVITSPAAGAHVPISNSLTITYVADGGTGIGASAGDGSTGVGTGTVLQPDNGSFTGFDVSALHAGAGSIGITRQFINNIPGTGFAAAEVTYQCGSPQTNVTWN